MIYNTAIIGGGACGLAAAVSCPDNTVILEKNQRVGKKILATGNGRCNISNLNASEDFYDTKDRKELSDILKSCSVKDIADFFKGMGLLLRYEDDGRIYPYSNQASSVLDCLRNEALRNHVEIKTEFEALDISKDKGLFKISSHKGEIIKARNVLISTGGPAGEPSASFSGYHLLRKFNHEITKISPALVPLKIKEGFCKSMAGIKFKGSATILKNSKPLKKEEGEILFTDYGLSGIAIMQLSSLYEKNADITLELDFFPEISYEELLLMLHKRKEAYKNENLEEFLTGTINKKLAQAILKHSGIEKLSMKAEELSPQQLKQIGSNLKKFKLTVLDTSGFKNAQVSKGGARLSEFNIKTMESNYVKGLYAGGEALDVNGLCGGFNLHFAWLTGRIAGLAIKGENNA